MLGYAAGFTKAIKNPMDYKFLLDENYKKVGSTFIACICLFEINAATQILDRSYKHELVRRKMF